MNTLEEETTGGPTLVSKPDELLREDESTALARIWKSWLDASQRSGVFKDINRTNYISLYTL